MDNIWKIIIFVSLGFAIYWCVHSEISCNERGGVLLRTVTGMECIKAEVVK